METPQHSEHRKQVSRRGMLLTGAALGGAVAGVAGDLVAAAPASAASAPIDIASTADQTGLTITADGQGASLHQNDGAAAGTHGMSGLPPLRL